MKNKLIDLIDFEKVNVLLEGFYKTTGFPTAILDLDGTILSKSNWTKICTEFHRVHPETAENCKISDTQLAGKIADGEKYHIYKCLNGLVDIAVPIVINGQHIANLFSGQFFLEKPDRKIFIKQAEKYNFDKTKYLEALDEVPVVSEETVKPAVEFLLNMIQLITEMTLKDLEQEKLTQALKKSEERFRLLYHNSPDMFVSVSPDDATILLCNNTLLKKTGYSREEVVGTPIYSMYHSDCIGGVKEAFEQFTKNGEVKNRELIIKRKDGSILDVSLNVYGVRDETGKILYSISSWRDISKHKKSEKDLFESNSFFEQLFIQSSTSTQLLDKDGWCIKINPKLSELFGVLPEHIEGKKYNILKDDEIIRTGVIKHLKKVFEKKETVTWEVNFDIQHASQSTGVKVSIPEKRWFKNIAYPILDANGELTYVIVQHEDITEHKQAELELLRAKDDLEKSEDYLNNIINNIGDPVFVKDDQSRMLLVNNAFCSIFDLPRNQIIGKTLAEDVPETERESYLKIDNQVLQDGIENNSEEYLTVRGGKTRTITTRKTRYIDNDGKKYLIGIIHDITQRKLEQNALIKSERNLVNAEMMTKIGNWSWDVQSGKVVWSDGVYRIFGFDRDTFKPDIDSVMSRFHPNDQETHNELLNQAIAKHEPYTFESRITLPDGSTKHLISTSDGVYDSNGNLSTLFGAVQDITERKQAEEALKQSTKRLIQAQQIAQMGDFTWDVVTGEVSWSDGLFDLLKYDKTEKIDYAKVNTDIHYPEDLIEITAWLNEGIASGKDKLPPKEYRLICKDGAVIYVRSQGIIERNEGGSVKLIATLYDITEQKKAEEKIRSVKENLKETFDISPGIICKANLDSGFFIEANQAVTRILGYSIEEFKSKPIIDFVHPEDAGKTMDESEEQLNGKEITFFENRYLCKDGSYKWMSWYSTKANKNNIVTAIGSDITKRKQTEAALEKRNEYIEKIMDNMPIGFAVNTINDGEVKYLNKHFESIYGWPKEVLTNTSIFFEKVFPDPEYREKMTAKIIADMQSGDPDRMIWDNLKIVTSQGETRYVLGLNIPIPDQNIMISTVQDVTNRKLAEDEIMKLNFDLEQRVIKRTNELTKSQAALLNLVDDLNEKSAQLGQSTHMLEKKNKELETFTYSVSHDLKAPLRGIDGYSKLLQDSYKNKLDGDANIFLTNIRESACKMNELIHDLLEYSRLERSQEVIEKIKIKHLIQTIVSIYKKELDSGKFDLKINFDEIEIMADSKGLTIAMRNLIENSIKFTAGRLNPTIVINMENDDKSWILSFEDNGIGFDMKYHQKIFDIFQRLHRAEDFPGTGIGLAMVNKAMQRMNGKVRAISSPGNGACFYLEIPKPI